MTETSTTSLISNNSPSNRSSIQRINELEDGFKRALSDLQQQQIGRNSYRFSPSSLGSKSFVSEDNDSSNRDANELLREQLNNALRQLEEREQEIVHTVEIGQELLKQIRELEEQDHAKTDELNKLKQEREELQKKIQECQREMRVLEIINNDLRAQKNQLAFNAIQLQEKVNSSLSSRQEEEMSQKSQCDRSVKQSRELAIKVEKLNEQLETMRNREAELDNENKICKIRIKELSVLNEKYAKENASLTEEIAAQSRKIEVLKAEFHNMELENKQLTAKVKEISQESEKLEASWRRATEEKSLLLVRVGAITEELEISTREVERLQNELLSEKAKHALDHHPIIITKQSLSPFGMGPPTVTPPPTEILVGSPHSQHSCGSSHSFHNTSSLINEETEAENRRLASRVKELEREVDRLDTKNQHLNEEVKSLMAENQNLLHQITLIRQRYGLAMTNNFSTSAAASGAAAAAYEQQMQDKEATLRQLQFELEAEKATNAKLKAELDEAYKSLERRKRFVKWLF